MSKDESYLVEVLLSYVHVCYMPV